jgi:hypothetical protein
MPQPDLDVRRERSTLPGWAGDLGTLAAGLSTDTTFSVTLSGGTPAELSSHVASRRPDKTRRTA